MKIEVAPSSPGLSDSGCDRKELRHVKAGYQKRQRFEEWVLSEAFRVEVAELAGASKDGLTPIGLKAALVIAQQMLEAEVASVAGTKEKHQEQR